MKIVLIGGPASGKTTVGKALAQQLKVPFFDTDDWVETQAQKKLSEIFATEGELVFRNLETQALADCLKQEKGVISTGGGIVKKAENCEMLRQCSDVIYLDVSVSTQLKRTENDTTRPLLQGKNKKQILEIFYQERDPLYRNVATQVIDANATVEKILSNLNKLA